MRTHWYRTARAQQVARGKTKVNLLEKLIDLIFGRRVDPELLKLEKLMTTPCRTPLRYAFYGTQDDQVARTKDFVNLVHVGAWGDWVTQQGRADLLNTIVGFGQQAKAAGLPLMFTCDWCLFTQTNPRHNLPRDNAVGFMIEFCDRLRDEGLIDSVVAWYPIDEPNIHEIGLSPQQIFDANAVVRDVTQHYTDGIKPLAVIYGASSGHYPGIEGYDWCGMDNYGSPIFDNGQYLHLVNQLNDKQKTIIVPGGANPWREDPLPFYEHAQTDTRVIMVMPFLWFSGDGIGSNGMAPQYQHVGNMIVETNPPTPEDPPMPEPVRFPAQIPYDASFWAIEVFSRMSNNDWAGAQTTYAQHKQAVDDSMGAMDYWRKQFVPGTPTGPTGTVPTVAYDFGTISPVSTQTPWVQIAHGAIFTAAAPAAGRIAANEDSGGSLIMVSLDINFTDVVQGNGTSGWINVAKDQKVYGRHMATGPDGQPMPRQVRLDWLPNT
jgi:hypothetical protein